MRPLSDEGDFQRGSINRHKNTPTGTLPWVHPPSHLDLLGTPSTTRDIFLKLQFSAHDGPFFLLSRVEMDWGSPIEGVSEGCDNHPKHVNFSKNVENCHRTQRYRLGARMTFTGVCQLFYVMLKWLDYKVSCNQMEVTRDEWIAFHSDLIVSVWIEFIDPVCSNRFSEAHEKREKEGKSDKFTPEWQFLWATCPGAFRIFCHRVLKCAEKRSVESDSRENTISPC